MTFPLMPGYDHINIVPELDDPLAAVADAELGERIRDYPKLFPAGSPDFGHAVQHGTAWRISGSGACDPSSARLSLASRLRRRAAADADPPPTRDALVGAADRLDPEDEAGPPVKDEWEIGDTRYRIIRIENYTLIGKQGMEPPRTTDTGAACPSLLEDFPLDPRSPSGQWGAQIRLNLVSYRPLPGTVPDQVAAEATHAITTHPGIVIVPPTFTIVEVRNGAWAPFTGGHTPADARTHLAGYFTEILPRLRDFQGDPATKAEQADWRTAAAQILDTDGPDFHALDRHFRTVRVSRFIRVGRDGPEAPRPSDQQAYGFQPD